MDGRNAVVTGREAAPGFAGSEEVSEPTGDVVTLSIASLVLDDTPRRQGEDLNHTRMLSEVDDLPPVLVHRETMRLLDGVHRVQAAKLRGLSQIRARYFDGEARAAFVAAVRSNAQHGLPLPLSDRKAAAKRIITTYPDWSDRAVAAVVGLSPKTVGVIRDGTGSGSQVRARIGRDGKARPLDASDGRLRAAAVIAERPDASIREIASSAGISVGTASDVRRRVQDGESPVPSGTRRVATLTPAQVGSRRQRRPAPASNGRSPSTLLQGLRSDPALRYTQQGRHFLQWLDEHVVEPKSLTAFIESVPSHCMYLLAELAAGCADNWSWLADELAERLHDIPDGGEAG